MPPLNPLPPSPFRTSPFTLLWAEVVRRLSASPELTKVKPFQAWQGGAASIEPLAFDELPALRITPAAGSFDWADECRFKGPFILEIEFGVKGLRATDLFDFWSAIARALSPSNEWMDILQPLGCYNVAMSAPALRPTLICENTALKSQGHITLLTNVSI